MSRGRWCNLTPRSLSKNPGRARCYPLALRLLTHDNCGQTQTCWTEGSGYRTALPLRRAFRREISSPQAQPRSFRRELEDRVLGPWGSVSSQPLPLMEPSVDALTLSLHPLNEVVHNVNCGCSLLQTLLLECTHSSRLSLLFVFEVVSGATAITMHSLSIPSNAISTTGRRLCAIPPSSIRVERIPGVPCFLTSRGCRLLPS